MPEQYRYRVANALIEKVFPPNKPKASIQGEGRETYDEAFQQARFLNTFRSKRKGEGRSWIEEVGYPASVLDGVLRHPEDYIYTEEEIARIDGDV